MINVTELEKRWIKFKIKSYIPYIVIIFSLLVILILFLTLSFKDVKDTKIKFTKNDIKKVEKTEVKKTKTKIEKETKTKTKHVKPPKIEKKLVLSPSLNFMQDMQNNTVGYYENKDKVIEKKHKIINKNNTHKIKEKEVAKPLPTPKKIKNSSIQIDISKKNAQEDIDQVIKRFKINNNPALSLFVAKKYYELGKYNKAYNYALITNEINSNIEASWIIFTKSLVKLNEKEMAIKTLKTYYKHSHSNTAKILLDEIKTGKFK